MDVYRFKVYCGVSGCLNSWKTPLLKTMEEGFCDKNE